MCFSFEFQLLLNFFCCWSRDRVLHFWVSRKTTLISRFFFFVLLFLVVCVCVCIRTDACCSSVSPRWQVAIRRVCQISWCISAVKDRWQSELAADSRNDDRLDWFDSFCLKKKKIKIGAAWEVVRWAENGGDGRKSTENLRHRKGLSCRRMCAGQTFAQIWMPTWLWAVSRWLLIFV